MHGGRAWLHGGMCGCAGGVSGCAGGVCGCMGGVYGWRGCAWLCGACVVVRGMRGCGGGHAWLGACMVAEGVWLGGVWLWGTCVVAGGHAWLGACMVAEGVWLGGVWLWGACVVAGGACMAVGGMHRIRRATVNERAVRILLECILVLNCKRKNVSECYASYDIYYIEKLVYLNFRKHHSLNCIILDNNKIPYEVSSYFYCTTYT